MFFNSCLLKFSGHAHDKTRFFLSYYNTIPHSSAAFQSPWYPSTTHNLSLYNQHFCWQSVLPNFYQNSLSVPTDNILDLSQPHILNSNIHLHQISFTGFQTCCQLQRRKDLAQLLFFNFWVSHFSHSDDKKTSDTKNLGKEGLTLFSISLVQSLTNGKLCCGR